MDEEDGASDTSEERDESAQRLSTPATQDISHCVTEIIPDEFKNQEESVEKEDVEITAYPMSALQGIETTDGLVELHVEGSDCAALSKQTSNTTHGLTVAPQSQGTEGNNSETNTESDSAVDRIVLIHGGLDSLVGSCELDVSFVSIPAACISNDVLKDGSAQLLLRTSDDVVKEGATQLFLQSSDQVVKEGSQLFLQASDQVVKESSQFLMQASDNDVTEGRSQFMLHPSDEVIKEGSTQYLLQTTDETTNEDNTQYILHSSGEVVKKESTELMLQTVSDNTVKVSGDGTMNQSSVNTALTPNISNQLFLQMTQSGGMPNSELNFIPFSHTDVSHVGGLVDPVSHIAQVGSPVTPSTHTSPACTLSHTNTTSPTCTLSHSVSSMLKTVPKVESPSISHCNMSSPGQVLSHAGRPAVTASSPPLRQSMGDSITEITSLPDNYILNSTPLLNRAVVQASPVVQLSSSTMPHMPLNGMYFRLPVISNGDSLPDPASPPSTVESLECRWQQCSQMFSCLDQLVNHVNVAHVRVERDIEYTCRWQGCPRNGRGFNARYKMLIHVRTHTNEKPHRCGICGKSFSRLENLKIHNRSHTGERPYVCPFEGCNKAYSNSSDRFKHVRTHQVDKPYCCKMPGCNKRYTDPSSLRKHIKTRAHYFRGHSAISSSVVQSSNQPLSARVKEASEVCQTIETPSSTLLGTPGLSSMIALAPAGLVAHTPLTTQVLSLQSSMVPLALASNPLLSSTAINTAIITHSTSTQTEMTATSPSSPGKPPIITGQERPLDLSTSPPIPSPPAQPEPNESMSGDYQTKWDLMSTDS